MKKIQKFENFKNENLENIKNLKNEKSENNSDVLINFFEENDFNVDIFEQDNKQCGEIEKWTNGGVDMIITLMPFTKENFYKWVDNFNIDYEIDHYRKDQSYINNFTIRESLTDFQDFLDDLNKIVNKLKKI
jgi:hypothetical protein